MYVSYNSCRYEYRNVRFWYIVCCINTTYTYSHCLSMLGLQCVGTPCATVIHHSSYCISPPYQTSDSAVFSAVRNVAVITLLTHHMYLAR